MRSVTAPAGEESKANGNSERNGEEAAATRKESWPQTKLRKSMGSSSEELDSQLEAEKTNAGREKSATNLPDHGLTPILPQIASRLV